MKLLNGLALLKGRPKVSKIFDDIIEQADELADPALLKMMKDELGTSGEDLATPIIKNVVRDTDALVKARVKATNAFESSIKSQEKKLLDDPESAALESIKKEIIKGASKEARVAIKEITEDSRIELKKTIKDFSDRKKLNLRDLTDAGRMTEEFSSISEQILGRIVGTPAGRLPYDVAPQKINSSASKNKGSLATPLHERAFGIDDILIEDALITDVDVVARNYVHSMAADLALVEKFGDIDMTKQFKSITDAADRLKKVATSDKELTKIQKATDDAIRDLSAIRDRIRGNHGLSEDPTSWTQRWGRGLLQANLITKLGGMTASAIPDIGRPVMVNGLINSFSDGFIPLFANFKGLKKVSEELRSLGMATDMISNSRVNSIADTMHNDYGCIW